MIDKRKELIDTGFIKGKYMTIEQERTIDLLIEEVKGNKHTIGVILCRSLAKNKSNKNSDVDVFIVVDDIDFEKRRKEKNYFWGTNYELEDKNTVNTDREENIKKFYALMKSNKYKASDDIENIIQVKYCIFMLFILPVD